MNKYIIKQATFSIGNKFSVYNENNVLSYIVSGGGILALFDRLLGSICSIGHSTSIKKIDGQVMLTIKKEKGCMFEKFEFIKDNEVFVNIKQDKKLTKASITVATNGDTYKIIGDIFARKFSIYRNKTEIANVKKFRVSLKDSYELNVLEGFDHIFLIGLVIVIDSSFHN